MVSACRHAEPPPAPPKVIRLATSFGPFTRRLAGEYRKVFPEFEIQEVSTPDSDAAVHAIDEGRADFGLAYADAVFAAYSSPRAMRRSPIRGVSLLEPLPAYFIVRADSGIRHASEIRGHRVGIPGSPANLSSWTLGSLVLSALGVEPAFVTKLPTQGLVGALTSGSIDVILLSGWLPSTTAALKDVLPRIRVLSVEGPAIEQLRREYPFIRSVTTPLVLYPGQPAPVVTVGMDVLVICRSDLDEGLVHAVTRELFLVYSRVSDVEATLRFLKLDEAPATPIPLHPGAARYFRERELSR